MNASHAVEITHIHTHTHTPANGCTELEYGGRSACYILRARPMNVFWRMIQKLVAKTRRQPWCRLQIKCNFLCPVPPMGEDIVACEVCKFVGSVDRKLLPESVGSFMNKYADERL